MRITEINQLNELRMSPKSLARDVSKINARAGMEFEMYVPGVVINDDSPEQVDDFEEDVQINKMTTTDDVITFFEDGEGNSDSALHRLRRQLDEAFDEYCHDNFGDYWDENKDYLIEEYIRDFHTNEDEETIQEYIAHAVDDGDANYIGAWDNTFDKWKGDRGRWAEWAESENIHSMKDIFDEYSIDWPFTKYDEVEDPLATLADEFKHMIGKDTEFSSSYHGAPRKPNSYAIEPDGSLDDPDDGDSAGIEFISPPMSIEDLIADLNNVKAWADYKGCHTNSSTGLHINVSLPDYDYQSLDYVKLAIFLGDEKVLDSYGRSANTYCKSAMQIIKQKISQNPSAAESLLTQMRGHMAEMASKSIHNGLTDKMTSINTKGGYIEFRSAGEIGWAPTLS